MTRDTMSQNALLPLFLKVDGRRVVVVGAGPVAERKVTTLRESGARVCVVAPDSTEAIARSAAAGEIEWRARGFADGDLDGAWLVFAATSDPEVQRRVGDAARERRVFCVAVDDPPNATAYSGSVLRRPPYTIAISSSGAAPALTRLLREVLESILPGDDWVEHAARLRAKWMAEKTPMEARFSELVRAFAERTPKS